MEMNSNLAEELAQEIIKAGKLIEAARIVLNKGVNVDIESLSTRILNICDKIPKLSRKHSRDLLPALERVIIDLEVFSAEMGITFDSYAISDIQKKDKIA
jgi:hypothetical protein